MFAEIRSNTSEYDVILGTEDGCSRQLEYLFKLIKTLCLWYFRVILRFLKDNENKLLRNLKSITTKLETNKSNPMLNKTCYKIYETKKLILAQIRKKRLWLRKKLVILLQNFFTSFAIMHAIGVLNKF